MKIKITNTCKVNGYKLIAGQTYETPATPDYILELAVAGGYGKEVTVTARKPKQEEPNHG